MMNKVIALSMFLMMAFLMMPMMAGTAYAATPDSMVLGTGVLSDGSNTSNAPTVHMAGTGWRVIGYNGDGVASSADTMTLISAGNLKGAVQFRADREAADANHYSKSDLKTEVDGIANTFSDGEKAGIAARDLASGSYDGANTDCIAGDAVNGALLWPLSTKEVNAMNGGLLIVDPGNPGWASNYWWLRSPGEQKRAGVVFGNGEIYNNGNYVSLTYGVRPAFNYNLNSVIFTSAAVGGKTSGTVGADALAPIGTNSMNEMNEWKMTVKSGHDSFAVNSVTTCDKKTLNIKYSGAVIGENEYISAIIKSDSGSIKYYGRLALASDEVDATAVVNIDGKMQDGDKLYIFNEQCNGDLKTDFSSELIQAEVTEVEHVYGWESIDDEKHKGTCTYCGDEITQEHVYSNGVCTICNGRCTHSSLSDSYYNNDDRHWKECEYCLEKLDFVEHSWQEEWTADEVQHWHECSVCQRIKDESAHSWDAGRVTKDATCTDKGEKTYTCTTCKATKTEEAEAIGHKYGAWTKLDDAQHQRVCEHDPSHIVKEDHTWDAGRVTKEATCTDKGEKTYTCTTCKATKTEEAEAIGHKYGAWTKLDDAQHQRVCEHDPSHIVKEAHTWDAGRVTKDATCTDKGEKTYTCTTCKATKTEEAEAIGHKYGAWTKLDDAQHQRVCEHDPSHIEKEDHTWDAGRVTKDATCTDKGEKTYTCTTCKATKTEEAEAIGHKYGAWTKLDDAQHQRVCEHDPSHIEKEAHTWDAGRVTKEATCTDKGEKTYTCTTCKATKTEEAEAIGHKYGAWTKLDDAQHQRVCEHAPSHIEKEAHTWDEGKVSTGGNKAVTLYTCTVCKATKEVENESKTYQLASSANGTWTKGSTSSLKFTFKSTEEDSETFDHFLSIEVDGKKVPEKDNSGNANWTKKKGSVIIELQPSYLETISVGKHKLTASFDDGNDVTAEFTVKSKAESPTKNNTPTKSKSPKTSDESKILLWCIMICAAIFVMIPIILLRNRRKKR